MITDLLKHLKRPELFAETGERFWDDPHIAAQAMRAHLDSSSGAGSRRPEALDASAAWLASMLSEEASVLDLGCGPGLFAARLGHLGLKVTGIDISDPCIEYARAHDPAGEYILGDYAEMGYDGEFVAVCLLWCGYGSRPPEDRAALLIRIYKALRPKGILLLDAVTPEHLAWRGIGTSWKACPGGGFMSSEPHIQLNAEYVYNRSVGLKRIVAAETNGRVRVWNLWDAAFTPRTLTEELEAAGFIVEGMYADAAGKPLGQKGMTVCAAARRP